jgi:hypothetical protein
MSIDLNEKENLGITITQDGIIELTLGGDVSAEEHKDTLIAWTEKLKEAITDQKNKNNGITYCLVDASTLHNFDEGSVEIVKKIMGWEGSKDVKTAIIGATTFASMTLRTIIFMTGRNNIKTFDSRENALLWLKS